MNGRKNIFFTTKKLNDHITRIIGAFGEMMYLVEGMEKISAFRHRNGNRKSARGYQ